jgi:hypothetical protein
MTNAEGSLTRAILPVIVGGLAVFAATTYYTDSWKRPEIVLFYKHSNLLPPQQRDILEFTNIGHIPADNLRITVTPDPNVVNFTMGQHTQNTTFKKEEGSWIIESRKFPVNAKVDVSSDLKNLSRPDGYVISIAHDQVVKEGTLYVFPENDTIQTKLELPPPIPVDILPAIVAVVVALLITIVSILFKIKNNIRLGRRDKHLIKINDEVYQYYTGKEVDINAHLNTLNSVRNDIKNDFEKRRIQRSDYETLENRILEHIEKLDSTNAAKNKIKDKERKK